MIAVAVLQLQDQQKDKCLSCPLFYDVVRLYRDWWKKEKNKK